MARARKYTFEVLSEAVSKSNSLSDLFRNLGQPVSLGAVRVLLKKRLLEYGISIGHFYRKPVLGQTKKFASSDILVLSEGPDRCRTLLLRRALLEEGVEFKCASCGLLPEWNGGYLNLEVDHVNCDWHDNRKENLQFLCPNCHSQRTQAIKVYCSCGAEISSKAKCCNRCHLKQYTFLGCHEKGKWPSDAVLSRLIWKKPSTILAKEIGVTSTMVKKRCKRLGIETPPRGYWTKLKYSK